MLSRKIFLARDAATKSMKYALTTLCPKNPKLRLAITEPSNKDHPASRYVFLPKKIVRKAPNNDLATL